MLNLKKALCAAAVGVAVATAFAVPALAQSGEPSVREVRADRNGYGGDVGIAVGGSQILRFAQPVGRIMIGDPEVGDVIPLTDHTVYVLGKKAGSTSLTVMSGGRSGVPIATFDLRVGYDVNGLQRMIADVVPGEPVQVRAGGEGVILSGSVSSSAAAGRAAMLAEQFAPGKVVNLISIRAAEQVMLSVRVAEVQRSVVKQLGMSTDVMWENGDDLGRLLSGVIDPVTGTIGLNPDAFGGLGASVASGDWTVDMIFDALERSGVSTTLAEPTLVALSGETANFFAGGEFPIPVVQNSGGDTLRTTIEWKTYGVSVGFTPTVVGDTINLAVAPEVSALDRENALTIQGFRVPAITARKARTTVELRDGQSFAIAGLIRRDFNDSLRGMPGVSKLPIFGALMRSTSFQNNETEVIIIVTVNRANPTTLDRLKSPIEGFRAPSEPELFINGTTEKPQAALEPQGDPIGEIISTASLD